MTEVNNKYMSDNLRDFPERPQDVNFWVGKKESYLSLSVIIDFQKFISSEVKKRFMEFQDKIVSQISNFRIYHNPYVTADGLFKYPYDHLHFTPISFLTYGYNFEEFMHEIVKADQNYIETKNQIIKVIEGANICKANIDLRWLYTIGKNGIDSFSIQVYPQTEFIEGIKRIRDIIMQKNILGVLKNNNTMKIKGYPEDNPKRFALNILRFINNERQTEQNIGKECKIQILDTIEKINKEHNIRPLARLKIEKISLVESDPFLYKHNRVKDINLGHDY